MKLDKVAYLPCPNPGKKYSDYFWKIGRPKNVPEALVSTSLQRVVVFHFDPCFYYWF